MFKLPISIIKDISNYTENLNAFLRQETSELRFKSLRVAWGIYAQRKENGYMIRIRIPGGQINSSQLEVLAKIAQIYTDGKLHFTTRQDIQIHSIKVEDSAKIMETLKHFDLSSRGSGGNTVRNITVSVLSGVEKDEVFDPTPWATGLSEYLLKEDSSYNLPRKFKIAFSNSSLDTAGATVSDLGFIANQKELNGKSVYGFSVYVGGGMGAFSRKGDLLEEFIVPEETGYVTEAVKRVFNQHGNKKNKHRARLRFLLEQLGLTEFKRLYQKELATLKETEHISLRLDTEHLVLAEVSGYLPTGDTEFEKFKNYNVKTQKQKGYFIIEVKLKLTDIYSKQLEEILYWTKYIPTLRFRLSPEQNLLLVNVPTPQVFSIYQGLQRIGLGETGANSILNVVTCAGATTCNLGLCNSRGLAEVLEQHLQEANLDLSIFKDIKIRISGCPNACGHHPFSPIGLYGLSRKVNLRSVPFYRIVLGGRVEQRKTKMAKEIGLAPARNVPKIIIEFLKATQNEIRNYTDFYDYLEKKGRALLAELISQNSYVPPYEEDASFYQDWGKEEDFSLAGLGPGECGAGVLELIESDLTEAKNLLDQKDYSSEKTLAQIISLCARALLVVRGIEPRTQLEAVEQFYKQFVEAEISSGKFNQIREIFKLTSSDLSQDERQKIYNYAQQLHQEIRHLYTIMDNNFNFPKDTNTTIIDSQKTSYILDLKGVSCPINYVKTRLALENLQKGEVLEIYLDEGEPIKNVPSSLKNDGEKILEIKKEGDFYKLIVQKS